MKKLGEEVRKFTYRKTRDWSSGPRCPVIKKLLEKATFESEKYKNVFIKDMKAYPYIMHYKHQKVYTVMFLRLSWRVLSVI